MTMRYYIKVKQDFGRYGWWDPATRRLRRDGFVVTDGICNIIPGAGWFPSIEAAFDGIAVHMITGDTPEFHAIYRARRKAREPRGLGLALGPRDDLGGRK